MRLEIILLFIASFIITNIYTDGKYMKLLLVNKKYIHIAGVVFGTFMIYILLKKNPLRAKEMLNVSNEYLKYLPLDKDTNSIISPILDFTTKQSFYNDTEDVPVIHTNKNEHKILNSGNAST